MSLDKHSVGALNLDPLYLPRVITPIQTPGVHGGINYNMIHSSEEGLLVQLLAYLNMQAGDWVQVFWDADDTAVTDGVVLPEQVGQAFSLYVPADRIPEGIHDLYATVTRSGGGNGGSTLPLSILVRTVFPGGTDPEPDEDGHQNLLAPIPELPPSGIIDEDAAKNGVKVTIASYPNMREFDRITLSWGGELLYHEVTQAEVDAGSLDILVDEATILAAGADDNLVLVYRVRDEVHNLSSDWSVRATVTVEVGEDLFDPPMIENPDPDAVPYEVIDLDDLGDDDLLVNVMVYNNGLLVDDVVTLTWTGTTAQGLPVTFTPAPQTVTRDPQSLPFIIPNDDVRVLGGGRGMAAYTVRRDDAPAGHSRRAFVSFVGAEQRLPKPVVEDAEDGTLAPELEQTTVIVPGAALEAGDIVYLTWLGTRANGSTLLHEDERTVSGGSAGQPMRFTIPGEVIAPLKGGSVSTYYRLYKRSIETELESEHEELTVGESQGELPAPLTNPPLVDGVLDPDNLSGLLELIVPHWPGMNDRQTVHLVWHASGGGNHDDFMPISTPMVGEDVAFYMDRETVEAYLDQDIQLSYWVETPGEASQVSGVLRFKVGNREDMDSGPMRVMGARFIDSLYYTSGKPRMLSALHDETLQPMRAGWWYEGDEQPTIASEWTDEKPWLALYVRNRSETWKCNPANVIGNGAPVSSTEGSAAFVAMRDEVMSDDGAVVDMVAWGKEEYGGKLDDRLSQLKNVVEIASAGNAFAARLGDGTVACWGDPRYGGSPPTISGDFVQVRGNGSAFAGLKRNGEMYAWGHELSGVPVPDRVLEHRDYLDLCVSTSAFAARRGSGHVVAWGSDLRGGQLKPGQELMDDIVQLRGNIGGFAALRVNGSSRTVISWGDPGVGVDVPPDIARLTNIRTLGGVTHYSFSVILETGEVKVWGIGRVLPLPEEIASLSNVVEVTGTAEAYCARLNDGTVAAWGHQDLGGRLSDEAAKRTDILQVTSNLQAFVALCRDGSVVAWGHGPAGGDTSSVAARLVNVRAIYPNNNGFCALTANGGVVTWGVGPGGGDSSAVQGYLNGRVTHSRLLPPDEAQRLSSNT